MSLSCKIYMCLWYDMVEFFVDESFMSGILSSGCGDDFILISTIAFAMLT